MLILKTFESDEQKKLLFFCFFLVVEEGLREPFHARDWLETYGQGPCGTLTIALSTCTVLDYSVQVPTRSDG